MEALENLGAHWVWIGIGLVLAALEVMVPGVYLIWLALAAIAAGLLTLMLGLGVAMQVVVFTVIAAATVYAAKRFLQDRPIREADPMMNKRLDRMVGETAVVVVAIDGGSGKIKVGDSEWIARGDDVAVGTRVRITGADGTDLLVEPA
ncbi:NfeD family protein [Altererythrobacter sp. ZODW24]|uniref:NfeD family protein n=1 Tax=Altererythrobacter sp. ZODW24 TaxID=2185142 RepID=UPI000DF7AF94|nr:NfeD family protein [Altererythrobacter sp. ZODW24]